MTIPPGHGVPEHDLNLLAAYAEGRLDPPERARMTQHLGTCAECRATLAELARSWERVGLGSESRAVRLRWSRSSWLPLAAALLMATLIGLNRLREQPRPPSSVATPAGPNASGAPPSAAPSASPATSPGPSPRRTPDPYDEGLLVKRGGVSRSTAGKTFRLVAGEWVDVAFDPAAGLPVVEARSQAERRALLDRAPALVPFAALGPRVVVVVEGTVYRFGTPASR